MILLHVTVENVGDVFLGHSVLHLHSVSNLDWQNCHIRPTCIGLPILPCYYTAPMRVNVMIPRLFQARREGGKEVSYPGARDVLGARRRPKI